MNTKPLFTVLTSTPISILVVLSGCAPDDPWHQWHLEYDVAQSEASRLNKHLLIDFGGSDWCYPCRILKASILSRPDFVERASKQFVLLDIDDLRRSPMPPGRKERYQKLQERFGIEEFPTVVLATPEGLAYAQTTYREAFPTPATYWQHLQPLYENGRRFQSAMERAEKLDGRARADALAEGLSRIHPEFVMKFHSNQVNELRELAPTDPSGYLKFLDDRLAVVALQKHVQEQGLADALTRIEEIDENIELERLQGEALQDALVLRSLYFVEAGRSLEALNTLEEMLDAQSTRSAFDRGDFIPLDKKTIEAIRWHIEVGRRARIDPLAQYLALHIIFEFILPDRFEKACGSGYRPALLGREAVREKYGRTLMAATADLQGEARAKALGEGLAGTSFNRRGIIKEIVEKLIPELVGSKSASLYLPERYSSWVSRGN